MSPKPPTPPVLPDPLLSLRAVLRQRLTEAEADHDFLRVPEASPLPRLQREMHFHRAPELFFQISGISIMNMPEERMLIRPGQLAVIPKNVPHVEGARRYRGPFINLVRVGPRFHRQTPLAPKIWDYFEDLIGAFRTDAPGRRQLVKGLLLAGLAALEQACAGEDSPQNQDSPRIAQCKYLVRSNIHDFQLGVKQLAAWMQCSADYLSFRFHQETGERLNDYINAERLALAQGLLEESTLNIAEVAHAAGYRDAGYFSRIFRARLGRTPKEYRRKFRI